MASLGEDPSEFQYGTSGIRDQSVLKINAILDSNDFLRRRTHGKHMSPYSSCDITPEIVSVSRGHLVLQWVSERSILHKRGTRSHRGNIGDMVKVFSVINGLYPPGGFPPSVTSDGQESALVGEDIHRKMIEYMEDHLIAVGISGPGGKVLIENGHGNTTDVTAVVCGGLTGIIYTGYSVVKYGDRIFWRLPTVEEWRDKLDAQRKPYSECRSVAYLPVMEVYDRKDPYHKKYKSNIFGESLTSCASQGETIIFKYYG